MKKLHGLFRCLLISAAAVSAAGVLYAQTTKPAAAPAGAAKGRHAVAVLHPTQGNKAHGVVHFRESDGRIVITADVEGLTASEKHAIHIHEFGDCSAADATSAGSHYNPEGHEHGLPEKAARHAGDLGNLVADAQGRAHLELLVDNISIMGSKNPVLGLAVIVHAKVDDGGQPVGNAGARIACGVIGMGKAE